MRSIEIKDPFALTFEEKIFRTAKRVCVAFAVGAIGLSALDILEIRSVSAAVGFWHESQPRIAAMGDTIRTGIQQISILPDRESVTVVIPKNEARFDTASKPAAAPMPAPKSANNEIVTRSSSSSPSPVAALAAVHQQDAVRLAMAPAMKPVETVAASQPTIERTPGRLQFASVAHDDLAMPQSESNPQPMLASLPAQTDLASLMPTPGFSLPKVAPLPIPAPGEPPPSPAKRLGLEGKEREKAERCLANAVYFEARSEPVRGQQAVAQVVMNRVFSPFYPNDVCGVVYQNAHRHLSCQFTFACDGKRDVILDRGSWARAQKIAKSTLDGRMWEPEVAKSTHYHAAYVHPYWVREMKKFVRYGLHTFYRPMNWGNGANEQDWGARAQREAKLKPKTN